MTAVAKIMCECAFMLGVSNIYIVFFMSDGIYLALHQYNAVCASTDTGSMKQIGN